MKLYVVSTKYLPLVTFVSDSQRTMFDRQRPIGPVAISKKDLQTVFENSKNDSLIACETLAEAETLMGLLIVPHNSTKDFVERGVGVFFGVPVIFEVNCLQEVPSPVQQLTAEELFQYPDRSTIPLCDPDPLRHEMSLKPVMAAAYNRLSPAISIRKLEQLQFSDVSMAHYLKVDMQEMVAVDMKVEAKPCCAIM